MKESTNQNSIAFNCPDEYIGKLFLTPADIMNIFGIGESLAYAYLKDAPFRTEKIGSKIFIFANSFWNWYNLGA